MPSLRELYERTNKYHSYNPALYDVLEALVEKWESQEQICGDCGFFNLNSVFPCDKAPKPRKPLQGIHGGAGACKNFRAKVEPEKTEVGKARFTIGQRDADLAAAKMTIRKLHKERDFAWEEAKDVRKSLRGYQDDCDNVENQLANANLEIARLRKDCDYLRRESGRAGGARSDARRQLAEAKVKIERLKTWAATWKRAAKHQRAGRHAAAKIAAERIMKCGQLQETVDMYADRPFWDDMHQLVVHKLRSKLSKAKTEIERLRKDPFDEHVRVRCQNAERARDRLINEHDRLAADAEIGRLVRGMADNTRLTRFFAGYAVEAQKRFSVVWVNVPEEIRPTGRVLLGARYVDPAEALRAIQEADNAKV